MEVPDGFADYEAEFYFEVGFYTAWALDGAGAGEEDGGGGFEEEEWLGWAGVV